MKYGRRTFWENGFTDFHDAANVACVSSFGANVASFDHLGQEGSVEKPQAEVLREIKGNLTLFPQPELWRALLVLESKQDVWETGVVIEVEAGEIGFPLRAAIQTRSDVKSGQKEMRKDDSQQGGGGR